MSGPPKSSGSFSFGNIPTSSGGGTGDLFGTTLTNNNSTGSPYGSGTAIKGGQSSNIFGQSNVSSAAPSLSSFGGTPATTAPATSLFGGSTNTSRPAPLFGGGGSSGGNLFGGGTNKPAGFGLFSTPSRPAEAPNPGSVQNASTFGGGPAASNANFFGNRGATSTTSSQPESSTPAATKPNSAFSFGGVSTTPAGPPPTGNVAQGAASGSGINFNIIGGAQQSSTSNLFGKPPTSSGSSSSGQTNSSSLNLPSQAANSFSTTPTPSSSSLPGAMSPLLFPKLSVAQESGNQVSQAPTPSTSLFPTLGGQKPLGQSSAPSSSPFVLGGNSNNPPSSTSGVTFNLPAFSSTQSSNPAAPGGPNSGASNLFGSLGAANVSFPTITGPSFSSAAPASTTAQTSTGLFGASSTLLAGVSKPSQGNENYSSAPEAPNATTQPSGISATAATSNDTNRSNTNLGTSTSGPRPPAQSRLKNKSMDEIITRWASDLSKYQKEFQRQAMKVSEWDRMLVENSEKIQKLYGSTLEAERATVEVERQLSVVENDQGELEYWLDHYERQVDELIATQIGQGDTTQGPDQERERTYKLAEKLADRLNEMGKDLTSMIENINDASSNLSKNGKPDDALSQIVRVLNGHLSQLQQIDQGAATLQSRVLEAQKASRAAAPMNGMNGIRNDAADDFYRSYMGRR
ncbi:FG-nucleoporin nsp1 [Xylographa vitiligo]|nr:FG-nucleoporin nsp1 [Xylographa vitiligo]